MMAETNLRREKMEEEKDPYDKEWIDENRNIDLEKFKERWGFMDVEITSYRTGVKIVGPDQGRLAERLKEATGNAYFMVDHTIDNGFIYKMVKE